MRIGYARVSTDNQDLTDQQQQLAADGCEQIFFEKVSGAKRDRPELNAMLSMLRRGDVVVVAKIDRLARSLSDLLELSTLIHEAGADLRFIGEAGLDTTTDQGKLMFSILGAFAEFERSLIVARTTRGRDAAKARGVKFGPKVKHTPEKLAAAAQAAREEGSSVALAAKAFGMSKATLYNYMQRTQEAAQ